MTYDQSIFPYSFECIDCPHDSAVQITHEEVEDAVPDGVQWTVRQAVNHVLTSKGWWTVGTTLMCPGCVDDLE